MPNDDLNPTPTNYASPIHFSRVYVVAFIYNFFALLTAYNMSTYLESYTSTESVGMLYAIGAAISLGLFLIAPLLLQRWGNLSSTLLLFTVTAISLLILGMAPSALVVVIAFLTLQAVTPIIRLTIDIFLEALTGDDESSTGSTRGLVLGLMGVAAVLAPFTMGLILGDSTDLTPLFYISAIIGVILIIITLINFRNFFDPDYHIIDTRRLLINLSANRDIRAALGAQFILQLYYAWTIIYIPLYFATEVGLSWQSISIITSVALLAFVFIQYPAGYLADKKWGEQEMMVIGFIIMAIAFGLIALVNSQSVLVWSTVLLVNRIGISLVEVTAESYFFKQVQGDNTDLLSVFRMMYPAGYIAGPLIAAVALFFLPLHSIFWPLGLLTLSGVFFALRFRDSL